jgi:hypothetical protein
VMLPDSSSRVLFMVAPNPATVQWEQNTPLVQLGIDPVIALQWVTLARALTQADSSRATGAARVTPPLRPRRGPQFVVLARNAKAAADQRFVLVVSDSASRTHWKTFASLGQVDTLLAALETTAKSGWAMASSRDSTGTADPDDEVDTPVSIVSVRRPSYPPELAAKRRIGRVWMMYVVGVDGRAELGSFRPLLSDDVLFTRSAIKALVQTKYRPARLRGKPVPQTVFQVITFRMP